MSDNEDDYLSDKFLASLEAASKPSAQKSYLQRRDEAKKRSERLQLENRMKSRREREEEAREEVLSKTLFERAEEDKQKGIGEGNKALSMMMKMGFKPGQALGDKTTWEPEEESLKSSRTGLDTTASDEPPSSSTKPAHRIEPLPLNEWMGKKGIGLGKRKLSASAIEKMAKVAKVAETTDIDTFRSRTREGYEERRAEGRLHSAQRTCVSHDTEAGIEFNVYWLNPNAPDSFPAPLLKAMEDEAYVLAPLAVRARALNDINARMRVDMQSHSLQPEQPLDETNDPPTESTTVDSKVNFDEETAEKAIDFLRMNPMERLAAVLNYLRTEYHYCFWCGARYASEDELETSCPGESEDDHD